MKVLPDRTLLKARCLELKLSRQQLAKFAGVSLSTAQRILSGYGNIEAKQYTAVVDLLTEDPREFDIEFNKRGVIKRILQSLLDPKFSVLGNAPFDYDCWLNAELQLYGGTINEESRFRGRVAWNDLLQSLQHQLSRIETVRWKMIVDLHEPTVCLHHPEVTLKESSLSFHPRGWSVLIHYRESRIELIEVHIGESFTRRPQQRTQRTRAWDTKAYQASLDLVGS